MWLNIFLIRGVVCILFSVRFTLKVWTIVNISTYFFVWASMYASFDWFLVEMYDFFLCKRYFLATKQSIFFRVAFFRNSFCEDWATGYVSLYFFIWSAWTRSRELFGYSVIFWRELFYSFCSFFLFSVYTRFQYVLSIVYFPSYSFIL